MPLDWADVLARYGDGADVPTVAGRRMLQVTSADADGVHIRNALWRDTLRREHLEKAVDLLEDGRLSRDAGPFVEEYRVHVADVRATSAAHVLKDLGFLE